MDYTLFISAQGDIDTYDGWKHWAIRFYKELDDKSYTLPDDWFKRVTKVLQLKAIKSVVEKIAHPEIETPYPEKGAL